MRIPFITTSQMIAIDRMMVEDYGILLIQMMENAGRSLASLARRLLGGQVLSKHVAVLCGAGNNGGGGMVAARHLHNWGAGVSLVVIPDPGQLKDVPARQFHILESMGVPHSAAPSLESVDLVIDAIIGYGLSGNPRRPVAGWIQRLNAAARPVLALDAPSGLDTTTGVPGNPCVRAAATLTLALPKTGLSTPAAIPYVGDLYLADISVPPQLYARLGLEIPPLFHHEPIVKL